MLDRLERRWRRWAATPGAHRELARWAVRDPALDGWRMADLDAPRSSPRADAMQAALVGLAQAGDQAAMLTLLNQLRPGLWCLARYGRRSAGGGPFPGPDDVVAVACERVLLHPLDRRPRSIAANILLDTRQRLGRAARPVTAGPPPGECAGPALDEPEVRSTDLDLIRRLMAALDGIGTDRRSRSLSAEVAYRAWILDQSAPMIAASVGLQPDAVRARLSRIRAAVRATAPPTND